MVRASDSLHELAGRGRLELSVRVGNSVDGCVDIRVAKGHIERYGLLVVGVGVRPSDDFWLICTSPGITPGDLTSLANLPADCSGGVFARKWRSDRTGQYLGSGGGDRGVA
jgi:hypothetical protein